MSKLDELINKLCPDGVEYKKLADICQNITTGKLNANAMTKNGKYPFFTCDAQPYKINTYAFNTEAILISGNGSQVGHINYYKGKFNAYQRTYVLSNFLYTKTKYLLHYLNGHLRNYILINSKKGSIPYITLPMLQKFTIPIPPIPVQEEIVRILDNFTELTTELTVELTARKKQYEYYRDSIFSNKNINFTNLKLSDIAYIYDGTHQTPKYTDSGINFISVENIENIYASSKYISEEDFKKYKIKPKIGDVFMTRIGSIGKCAVFTKQVDIAYYVSLALIKPNPNIVNGKYLKYVIESKFGRKELRKRTLVNAVPIKINKDDIGKIILPVPSLEEQQRIVDILDRFDKLCNDISEGLPAEIEARKKQYEYYRDKLLTFKEKTT